jgi:hypothetical protein
MYCGMGAGTHLSRATRGDNREDARLKNKRNAEKFFQKWGFIDSFRSLNRMNIADKISDQTKAALVDGVLEFQILQKMINTLHEHLQTLTNQAMTEAKVAPDQYNLSVDPRERTFMLSMKNEPAVQKVSTSPVKNEGVKPAGDTKTDEPAMAGQEVKV